MPTSLSPRLEGVVLPSLPSTPSFLEEVFSHPRPWSLHPGEFDAQGLRPSSSAGSLGSHAKGKEKQTLEDEGEGGEDEDAQHRVSTHSHEVYPPMTDETAETRRVEETLKRWELAERQRRKTVRESAARHSTNPSILSSVTRTASLVLSRRTPSIGGPVSPGGTRAFKSHETVDVAREGYAVPLDDIDHATRGSSGDVAVHSPSPSLFDRSTSLDAGTGTGSNTSENPFVHPSERTRPYTPALTPVTPTPSLPPSPSPFSDARAQQALQVDPSACLDDERNTHARKRSSRSGVPQASPPPLPPKDIPYMIPLRPTPQPVLRPRREDAEEGQEVRWWHDWLCGCGEGPDRGGDNQAGRTNPFE